MDLKKIEALIQKHTKILKRLIEVKKELQKKDEDEPKEKIKLGEPKYKWR